MHVELVNDKKHKFSDIPLIYVTLAFINFNEHKLKQIL